MINLAQSTPASGYRSRNARWRSRRLLLPLGLLGVAVLVVTAAMIARWMSASADPGLEFVIPAGTEVNIPTVDSAIAIPTDIRFGPDDTAVITIRNDDAVAQRAGPWVIGAGQTYTARFDEPGVYGFACAVDESESVTVTVLDENGNVPD